MATFHDPVQAEVDRKEPHYERAFPHDDNEGRAGVYKMKHGQWVLLDHDRRWEDGWDQ